MILLWVLLLNLMMLPAVAQEAPKKGQNYQVTRIDLNADSKPEKVGLSCFEVQQSGWYSRLTVWNSQGQKIWQSMPAKVGVWAFGGWDWGISDLQWVGDIDGDGAVEAISPSPVSDVSPDQFRVYRWSGKAFHHVRTATLLPSSPGEFGWFQKSESSTWIGAFKKGKIGVIWTTGQGGEVELKEARLAPSTQGFRVLEWLKP